MKKCIYIIISVLVLNVLLTSCGGLDITSGSNFDKEKISEEVISSNSQFAFDIFAKLNEEDSDKNVFISPLSISTALTMTMQGANSNTLDEMMKALKYDRMDIETINESYKNLLLYMNQIDKKIELNINNSIWLRKGESILEEFKNVNKGIFNAPVYEVDFFREDAADTINNWISKSTNNKIREMIQPPIDPSVIMYLINAIYFKGEWTHKFDKNETFKSRFYTGNGNETEVMMMRTKGEFEYGIRDDFKVLRLPYGNGKTSMYCILPSEDISINQFINNLNESKWEEIRESVSNTKDVLVNIPRFNIEYGIKSLKDVLISMGMEEPFYDQADFSKMRGSRDIYIDEVFHKAIIEVNEEGSEAAGVTVVVMKELAVMEPLKFIANRPFVFLIADDTTDTVIFMGKLYNP
ncbi:UNVERIFIED_CONTAM: serpin B [Acetivibrio alkalicellulosi]